MSQHRNITRVDDDLKGTHAWIVTVQRQGNKVIRPFSDGTYGGKKEALAAAIAHRDSLLASHSPFEHQIWVRSRLRRNNTSGVPGVGRYEVFINRKAKHRTAIWLAMWDDEQGRRRTRKFSVSLYGERQAKELAIAERERQLHRVCALKGADSANPAPPAPSANADWLARSQVTVWHPCTQMRHHAQTGSPEHLPLLPIARGQGAWLVDFDDRRYLDGISSWWTNLFGHANPRINAALRAQLKSLEHVMLAGCTHQPVIELSERLAALTGGALGHAFYASDGASAIEIALKMSFHYWRNAGHPEKAEFLCLAGAYHGETVGALAVTDVAIFRDAYAPLTYAATHVLPSPDARLAEAGETPADAARRAAGALEQHLQEHGERTAALIVEPLVQGAAGMVMHDPEYLRLARALCDRHEVHLICDEIAVGCGRTGTFFAHEQAGIRPDLLCLSKGISGGYLPLSVVLCRDAIFDAFLDDSTARAFLHSHSYTGNPLACRAALATLDIFADDDVLTANRLRAQQIAAALQPLAAHPQVRHPRQRGMIAAFDVATDDPHFSRRFYRAALDNEALLRPIGNTVYWMPPYVVDAGEIAHLGAATARALEIALA